MNLDLRIPMGLMFTLIGIILAAFGASNRSNVETFSRSLGLNVDLWWGIVLFVFGQVIFQLGRRQKRLALPAPESSRKSARRRNR